MHITLIALLGLSAALCAQSVVVPNASATTSSSLVLNNPLRNSANPRTYMMGINAAELTGIPVGALITGISMRAGHTASNAAIWPASDVTFSDYEVTLGDCLPPINWTSTFMNNFIGTPVMARDGVMVVQANAFTNTNPPVPAANEWGTFYWDFQVPFVYTGGDLGVLMTHPGSNDPSSIFFEQVASNVTVHGQAITNSSAFQAPTATTLNYAFCVIRVHYGYGNATGCAGSNGLVPMLVQSGDITGGGTIHLATANGLANGVAIYSWGLGRINAPIGGGCSLLVAPMATSLALLDHNGRCDLLLNIPAGVLGTINTQVFVLDSGAPMGFTATNGVQPAAR